ncbi:isopentenyl-diphosphate Delta-isomerase [Candidatus Kaiserbacteria bacterium]|nr:isopentenyl-diphosphate Delta-isomerase [Candidatus Kaiserbacteria bacterium]
MEPLSAEEVVVLVDEENNVLGTQDKSAVHGATTPLHRGFSLFLFDRRGHLLLQQRSHVKKTWPLVWSNSVCGHPTLGETNVDAAKRRLSHELRMSATLIEEVAPYRYCFTRDGVMENEICPILLGQTLDQPNPNGEEVEATRWVPWQEFLHELDEKPGFYSPWCEEEARILDGLPRFHEVIPTK